MWNSCMGLYSQRWFRTLWQLVPVLSIIYSTKYLSLLPGVTARNQRFLKFPQELIVFGSLVLRSLSSSSVRPSITLVPSLVISEYVNPYILTHTPEEFWSDHMQTPHSHFICGPMSDLVICKFKTVWSCTMLDVLTETRSLNNTKLNHNFRITW